MPPHHNEPGSSPRSTPLANRASTPADAMERPRLEAASSQGGATLNPSAFRRCMKAKQRPPRTIEQSDAIRAAVEQLYREGNWNALVQKLIADGIERTNAENLVSDSFERVLDPARGCNVTYIGGVYAWIARDIGYALRHYRKHDSVAARQLIAAGNALPRPGEQDGPDRDVSQHENIALADRLLSSFTPRDRDILCLAWGEGEKKPEIARQLGVSPRIVKRTLEDGRRRLQDRLVTELGYGCNTDGEQLIRELVFQHANPAQRAQAVLHMRNCRKCRQLHSRLKQVRAGAAALAPMPALPHRGTLGRALEQAQTATTWLREQTTMLHSRLFDVASPPYPLPRPAEFASVGGCALAAAGMAICVEEITPPIRALTPHVQQRAETRPQPPADTTTTPADTTPSIAPVVPSPPAPTTDPTPEAARVSTDVPAAPARVNDDFDIEAHSAAQPPTSPPVAPPPTPAEPSQSPRTSAPAASGAAEFP